LHHRIPTPYRAQDARIGVHSFARRSTGARNERVYVR
jgi:hypothetical protein